VFLGILNYLNTSADKERVPMIRQGNFPVSPLNSVKQGPQRFSAVLMAAGLALLLGAGCQGPVDSIQEQEGGAAQEIIHAGGYAVSADNQQGPRGLEQAIARLRQREAGERYRLRNLGGAFVGDNPAHQFTARFGADGVEVAGADKTYTVGLRLARWGFQGALQQVSTGSLKVEDNSLRYTRRAGLEEWYLNGPGGLEQGFNIARRPVTAGTEDTAGPLVLELAISGNVEPRLAHDASAVTFHDLQGRAVAVYRDLWVEDARGQVLEARLGLESGRVRIEVAEAGAAYPLVVDPMLMGVVNKVLATDGSSNDNFGRAVSLDGDTALVGANGDDDRGSGSGSVYVFMRDNSRWLQHQKLTAGDGAAGDNFGFSVSLKGDLAMVGAYGNDDKGSNTGSAYLIHSQRHHLGPAAESPRR